MTEYMKTLCEITKIETKANITHRFTNPLVNLAANLQEEIADETNSDDGSKLKALFTFNENEEKRRKVLINQYEGIVDTLAKMVSYNCIEDLDEIEMSDDCRIDDAEESPTLVHENEQLSQSKAIVASFRKSLANVANVVANVAK